MVQGDVGEKHRVFNSRTDVDGQAIRSISHQLLIEHHAIIPPAIVEYESFYWFVVERKIDCSAARGLILYLRSSIKGKIVLTDVAQRETDGDCWPEKMPNGIGEPSSREPPVTSPDQ